MRILFVFHDYRLGTLFMYYVFIPLWKRNALWELVIETMQSLVSENEKLFVCGVLFQFVGSAECLLNDNFE